MLNEFDKPTEEELAERERFASLAGNDRETEITRVHERALLENTTPFSELVLAEQEPEKRESLAIALAITEAVKQDGGLALVVGGYARDAVLKRAGYDVEPKDIDIEVYGLDFDKLKVILERFGEPNVVGASFGVIKLRGLDISIPRRDSKTGRGHKGFRIEGDPSMQVRDAARRRDFTINALALDPITGEVVDKFGGIEDIRQKVLRATDPEFFADDPLRVLRAMQFAGRFEFAVDPDTVKLCREIDLSELSKERVGEEWTKLLLKSRRPSIGLEAARGLGVLEKIHPELNALISVPQEKKWHPEGDVWTHTGMVADAAAEIVRREKLEDRDALVVMLASLCHDLGKPATTTKNEKGVITSHGHEEAGIEPAKRFLENLKMPGEVVTRVTKLVVDHLFPAQVKNPNASAVRRLARRLAPATIRELVLVSEADQRGRAIEWHGFPAGEKLLRLAEKESVVDTKPEAILMGRHLIEMGVTPGPPMGKILHKVYEAQLEGKVNNFEEAQTLARELIERKPA